MSGGSQFEVERRFDIAHADHDGVQLDGDAVETAAVVVGSDDGAGAVVIGDVAGGVIGEGADRG